MNPPPYQALTGNRCTLRRARGWWGFLLAMALLPGRADTPRPEAKPVLAPPADWVAPLVFDRLAATASFKPGEDQRWLLVDRQLHAGENERFQHTVRQILSVSGVQNGSTLTLDFDPTYQSLTIHWVRIWRGTNRLNRLDADKIKLIQPERDLDQYLYNGTQSAVLVLDDVRIGDIIDCAYSLKGENPVQGGCFFSSVPVQMEEATDRLATRLLWPGQRRLYARNHNCAVVPALTQKNGLTEYTWDFRKVAGIKSQDSLPAWYDPEPWVQLSELHTWAEVNQWALKLFPGGAEFTPELGAKIDQWRRLTSREEQVLAVLRFVQDEIRYFGVEIGASSHKPCAASLVFSRRYGDCKDKALLFVTILRALGIEAYPVLVNTTARQTLEEWQPSAVAFDHVIAQVRLGGRTNWLDPTASYQGGSLAAHYLPNYGKGLVIHPATAALTAIPGQAGPTKTASTEFFELRGKLQPADLRVVTIYEGLDADRLRALFATTPRDDLEKDFVKHYAGLYPGIKTTRPLLYADDERQNRIELTENYTIDKLWVKSDRDQKYRCQFYPSSVAALLTKPADTARTMPLAVRFPRNYLLRTEVMLTEKWAVDTQTKTISDPAFSYRMYSRFQGTRLVMEYEYHSLADSVPANRAAEYLQRLDQASQSLGLAMSSH